MSMFMLYFCEDCGDQMYSEDEIITGICDQCADDYETWEEDYTDWEEEEEWDED